MFKKFIIFIPLIFIMCTNSIEKISTYSSPDRKDHHSFSNPHEALVTHINLDLEADFKQKVLSGKVQLHISHENASEIILDTRDLDIIKVSCNERENIEVSYGDPTIYLGQALHIPLVPDSRIITIEFRTRPEAAALQWLAAEQTTDKKLPFLFTQGQAILTRTWIPCQDSPGIRVSYNARIKVPKEMMAVMSASNPKKKNDQGIYEFEMKQPIPAYLIALAIGDIEYGEIGPRTAVYAEPSMLEKSIYEFADMEKMLIAAEELYGPYLWERYDVIVLPASFPFGGMENPRLTFATPTIIAGDRSLTALIAHELAHSWSGNLVTNATWNDFWLNEGFTVYFERRIMEALYGEDYASMLAVLGYQDLEADVHDIGHSHADTHLKLNLKDRDPDDGMTDIAYEKGAYFLGMLESKFGKSRFDKFLTEYFESHKFQTITTTEFVEYLNNNLLNELDEDVNVNEWIYGPGIPESVIKFESDKFAKVEKAISVFYKDGSLLDQDWTTHEWLHFIRNLAPDLGMDEMTVLDSRYQFSNSGNSEIAAAWYEQSIRSGYFAENIDQIRSFLVNVGRRKFLTPLYRALKETDNIALAKDIYASARNNYHAVSVQTIDDLLDFDSK
ncbi:MAG: M1 family metallopeptidase [Saprospiraceae bacterium]|nr:M1 family metallopeptidase [Saprospiraceae bacterium]